ncbi:uncharacterized protein BDZ99DRAFT_534021 [Mytilinidion resinicola]|uniref:Uncharacterized protein n=1 Tax=Mytilinidion resinicola TaxID=574789 RepID=A0A6A6YMZ9_9PEZI|nr:uncharacterized protein BDZ99DRAFT_534021 [Mytilinidion resinicola]KAF2809247.1 hypothetical protein BDZ99DRAFT_534021 [Mytilinidion resinicola]
MHFPARSAHVAQCRPSEVLHKVESQARELGSLFRLDFGAVPAQRSITFVDDGVSLDNLLVKSALIPQEKYALSITLTSSLLQLSHTLWLPNSWNKTDIIFLRAKGGSAVAGTTVDVKASVSHPRTEV